MLKFQCYDEENREMFLGTMKKNSRFPNFIDTPCDFNHEKREDKEIVKKMALTQIDELGCFVFTLI